MPVYLAQLKCPSNHCVLGAADEYPDLKSAESLVDELRSRFGGLVARKAMNPWCGICNSRKLNVDLRVTGFATMEEAMPALMEAQRRQLETREFLKRSSN